jgi:hypothetical protein
MRKEWFQFVKATREKETRKRKRTMGKDFKPCSHKESMKISSVLWPKEKLRLLKKKSREQIKPKPEQKDETKESEKH